MKFTCTGRLASVKLVGNDKNLVSISVAETGDSYKPEGKNDYVTPFASFLLKADSAIGKFVLAHANETASAETKKVIDVVSVNGSCRQSLKEGKTETYINAQTLDVISWKDKKDAKDSPKGETADDAANYPWN